MDEHITTKKQCFTSIQKKKLLGAIDSFQLCPSMDLVVFGTSSTSASLQNLFRTVSWQKVASINLEESEKASNGESTSSTVCWSPNGRWIAVAKDSQVSLYGVEPLANPPTGTSFSGSSGPSEKNHSWRTQNPVISLYWAHVGRPHATAWKLSLEEEEEQTYWSYQQYFLDKSLLFLPPSAYHQGGEEGHNDSQMQHETPTSTALPECKTPLSVLCVSTRETIEFYLHGRYPLIKAPRMVVDSTKGVNAVASNDLTYFVFFSQVPHAPSTVSIYHLPFLKTERYPLQAIASLHSSIESHLGTLKQSIPDVMNAWKSSLKPLDTKIQPLIRLLQNYGVDNKSLGEVLKQFILIGHTSESSSLANAMDQFFTSVQMNDQLLQRMIRTLYGALGNVESQTRRSLLSPVQALVYQIQELSGFVKFYRKTTTTDSNSIGVQDLVDRSYSLLISVELLMKSIIESRYRVRDFCGYLRHAGSEIKARGTAPQSVQRENAKKRRVPQAVIERLLAVMNTKVDISLQDESLTEQILSIPVSTMLKESPSFMSNETRNKGVSSPKSVIGDSATVAYACNQVSEAVKSVFVNPIANLPESIVPQDITLPQFEDASVAIHTRIGKEPSDDESFDEDELEEYEEASDKSYFCPQVVDGSYSANTDCRQWTIVSQAHDNIIQLYAIPLQRSNESEDTFAPFYLTTSLLFPSSASITDTAFYSDDGKSSLSSGNDSGTGKEGRQKLGVLLRDTSQLQVWLLSYDSAQWQALPFKSTLIHPSDINSACVCQVTGLAEGADEDEMEVQESAIFAQTRNIEESDSSETEATNQLWLCGSRGVGGVTSASDGVTSLELLDLEEDEFDDEDDDDDEFEEDD
ncbi:unnamed protein product [Cylindrotheca closterium]|uniref:Anaphase-promoting complex subunit 4 n=1 Tax=Cylindrotheca closterium TaxID=2856 RepID=A0AAD2GBZ5_9STRA|nr:unnamed protein product [Cylindrotheca closterium]